MHAQITSKPQRFCHNSINTDQIPKVFFTFTNRTMK